MDSHIWALLTSRQCTVWYSILRWPSRPLVSNFTLLQLNEVESNSLKCSFFKRVLKKIQGQKVKLWSFEKVWRHKSITCNFISWCVLYNYVSALDLCRVIFVGGGVKYHNPQAPGVINFSCNTKKYISYLNNTYYIGRGYIFLQEKLIT